MSTLLGLDVSEHQGAIDWPKLAASARRPRFVVVRASAGASRVDKRHAQNTRGARRAGLAVGHYHYAYPDHGDAKREARFHVATSKPKPGDLPPVLDLEEKEGLTWAELREWALTFLGELEELCGRPPMIYGSSSFLASVRLPKVARRYPLWVAHWGVKRPTIPAPWTRATLWQWTSSGKLPGIAGRVDLNYFEEPDPFRDLRL